MAAERALRTLIVDDEPLAVERMQILCAQLDGVNVVGTAHDGEAALRMIETLSPDLLLLDIAMPGLDGMEVARVLQARPARPALVFCTAYDQHALAAFDVAAADYVLKPVCPERLARAVERVKDAHAPAQVAATEPDRPAPRPIEEFWVPHRSDMVRISAADIDRVDAERDYMRLTLSCGRSFLVHQTISELERRLDPALFVRLHRSTIVRRDRIVGLHHDSLGSWRAALADGSSVRIGRTYQAVARAIAGR